MKNYKLLISGGGTGGHVFPAIAIADAVMKTSIGAEILFVGAEGKLEMERVPQAGYSIKGLPVIGFPRKLSFRIFSFLFRLIQSMIKARAILKEFRPDCVVGVGGYVSGPVLWLASRMKIPALIQEQNSYAGITNRMLASRVNKICVAYESMGKYFPVEKLVFTGNPVRSGLIQAGGRYEHAFLFFELDPSKRVILILGGSLGAATINRCMLANLDKMDKNIQLLWQCGQLYHDEIHHALAMRNNSNIFLMPFIDRMDLAYSVADVIISRAGALTISELELVGKPCILVPSPNVAEDHQTKNAMALVSKGAALIIRDDEAMEKLMDTALDLLKNDEMQRNLSSNLKKMGISNSADKIASEVIGLMKMRESGTDRS